MEKKGITLMKDISLMKLGATGEKLYYKAQDFLYEDVLFQYCQRLYLKFKLNTFSLNANSDSRLRFWIYWTKHFSHTHYGIDYNTKREAR